MRRWLQWIKGTEARCALWIALCFSLTSAVYLSWMYHLMDFSASRQVDWYSMVAGYGFQALGAAGCLWLLKGKAIGAWGRFFRLSLVLFCILALPAMMGATLAVTLIFGFLMNGMCGVIAGFYLAGAAHLPPARRGTAFGLGYGVSTVLVFLLSLPGSGGLLRRPLIFGVDVLLALGCGILSLTLLKELGEKASSDAPPAPQAPDRRFLRLALVTALLVSLVKNLGFGFPSADVASGAHLELSRLFYAVGLVTAGIIGDKNRKYGALCTVVALVLPFMMLSLTAGSVSALVHWALDYLFYGFFSVFRVVLFMDAASRANLLFLAPLGLVAGRVGDAAGTALYLALEDSRVTLVALALVLFIITMFHFFRLYQRLYMPEAAAEKSEREVFEGFSIQHDLSTREKEVLRLVLSELSNTQIADALFVSESTIKYHVHNLLQKTGCKSRQDLIRKYNVALYPEIGKK